jgi:hypothetical protein
LSKKVKTSIYLDPQLLEEIKIAVFLKSSVTDAIDAALRMWLEASKGRGPSSLRSLPETLEKKLQDHASTLGLPPVEILEKALLTYLAEGMGTPIGGVAGGSVVKNTGTTQLSEVIDWRIEAARAVLNSEHPIAATALEANIMTFHMAVEQYEASIDKRDAEAAGAGQLPPEEQAARLNEARAKVRRIRERLERLREHDARANKPVPHKRGA